MTQLPPSSEISITGVEEVAACNHYQVLMHVHFKKIWVNYNVHWKKSKSAAKGSLSAPLTMSLRRRMLIVYYCKISGWRDITYIT